MNEWMTGWTSLIDWQTFWMWWAITGIWTKGPRQSVSQLVCHRDSQTCVKHYHIYANRNNLFTMKYLPFCLSVCSILRWSFFCSCLKAPKKRRYCWINLAICHPFYTSWNLIYIYGGGSNEIRLHLNMDVANKNPFAIEMTSKCQRLF